MASEKFPRATRAAMPVAARIGRLIDWANASDRDDAEERRRGRQDQHSRARGADGSIRHGAKFKAASRSHLDHVVERRGGAIGFPRHHHRQRQLHQAFRGRPQDLQADIVPTLDRDLCRLERPEDGLVVHAVPNDSQVIENVGRQLVDLAHLVFGNIVRKRERAFHRRTRLVEARLRRAGAVHGEERLVVEPDHCVAGRRYRSDAVERQATDQQQHGGEGEGELGANRHGAACRRSVRHFDLHPHARMDAAKHLHFARRRERDRGGGSGRLRAEIEFIARGCRNDVVRNRVVFGEHHGFPDPDADFSLREGAAFLVNDVVR
jgi:hypothetical protein